MITQFAPAKLNLCLHITGRCEDNDYHILDSLVAFTEFGDHIQILPAASPALTVTGTQKHMITGDLLSMQADSPNLIAKALYAMSNATGNTPNVHIKLDKNIPTGAGLGGGTSDAAATLLALNILWGHPLTYDNMVKIGLTLGADMPVCLARQATHMRGMGEDTTPIPHLPNFPVLIVYPAVPLLTAQIFSHYRTISTNFDTHLPAIPIRKDKAAWIDYLSKTTNGLTATAAALCPDIKNILEKLDQQKGCRLARMSGSGSACFGIFEDNDTMDAASTVFDGYYSVKTRIL